MRVHLCGVRGSTPAPGPDFVRYGGHTSCVAVSGGPEARPALVLDAGTGVRRVTTLLGDRPFAGTILLTHLHWDHVEGLPFFTGGDRDDARVSLLLPRQAAGCGPGGPHAGGLGDPGGGGPGDTRATGAADRDDDRSPAEAVLEKMMSPPNFPIRPAELRGRWSFSTVDPGTLPAGAAGDGLTIEAREVPHKGGRTFGYRVSDGRSTIAYVPDHCPTVYGPGPDGWGAYHPAALELAREVDLLLHDAHLLPDELPTEARFGHAAADYAVALGARAGARKVVLFHHRPDRTDVELDELGRRLGRAPVAVAVGAEQAVFDL